jgi:hypothetical protein
MKLKIIGLLAVGMIGMSGVASANLIQNGGFETGSFSGWSTSGLTCSGVGSSFGGATGGCVGYDADPGPNGGAYAAYLGTAAGGGIISQTFATYAGQSYFLDFDLAIGAYNGSPSPNSFVAQVDGLTLFSILNAPAQGFSHYSFNFIGSGSLMNLSLISGNAPSFFILDDVSVRVPEPGTLAVFGLFAAGLGLIRRRRSI